MCAHYLPVSKELEKSLIANSVPSEASKQIAKSDRWSEGYYIYWIKNNKLLCQSHSNAADAKHSFIITPIDGKITFTVETDPNSINTNNNFLLITNIE
jgi:hypothetical protein